VLSLSAADLRLEPDLSPLLAVMLMFHVAAQSLLDVNTRLWRRWVLPGAWLAREAC
jgi:hypothetical protein